MNIPQWILLFYLSVFVAVTFRLSSDASSTPVASSTESHSTNSSNETVYCGDFTCYGPLTKNCTNDKRTGIEICDCVEGYAGNNCTEDRNECFGHHPCRNRGPCINTIGSFVCTCLQGWNGSHCEGETGEPKLCMPGFRLPRCTTDIDECKNSSLYKCSDHQECKNTYGNYTCVCAPGWRGDNCTEDVNECTELSPCKNGATCINTIGAYSCACSLGYTAHDCETEINECLSAPCLNNGTCSDLIGSYSCKCPSFWEGPNCEQDVDECKNGQCKNNDKCTNSNGSFDCSCLSGWDGFDCSIDVDECQLYDHCLNNATCSNVAGSYNCYCEKSWRGKDCSLVDNCYPNPCNNSGSCVNVNDTYNCQCARGFNGTNCDDDIDECSARSPCKNGANCSNTFGSYDCDCPYLWHGQDCDQSLFSGHGGQRTVAVVVAPTVVCVVLVAGLVVGIVLIDRYSKRNKQTTDINNGAAQIEIEQEANVEVQPDGTDVNANVNDTIDDPPGVNGKPKPLRKFVGALHGAGQSIVGLASRARITLRNFLTRA